MSIKLEIEKDFGAFTLQISAAAESKRIGILGASGCGKSMTLKCLAGVETPDKGIIQLDDQLFFDKNKRINRKPQERNIGYLFQEYALFPNMTVQQNIAAGIKDKNEKEKRTQEMIEAFHLSGLERHLPHQLSGGQKQRTALARIMAYNPQMILLDEPFSALDVHLRSEMIRMLQQLLSEYAGTVVMVSHSCEEIYRFSDYLLVMDNGQIIAEGRTEEVFRRPHVKQAALLTGCSNILKAEVKDEHTVYIPECDVTVKVETAIDDNVQYIGIRPRDFYPVWDVSEAKSGCCIKVSDYNEADLPYEAVHYVKAEGSEDCVLEWAVADTVKEQLSVRGIPAYLGVKDEDILLLS